MALALCPFCQREVLGLIGQDISLDTFYLQDTPEDTKVIETEIFGMCHFLCLTNTRWGRFWSRRILENMATVRKFPIRAETKHITILRNDQLQETIVIRQDGWLAYIDDKALKAKIDIEGGCLIPISHELNLDLSDHPELSAMVQDVFIQGYPYALLDIVNALNLAGRLLYPQALKNGTLVRRDSKKRGKKAQAYNTSQSVISTKAKYFNFLPEEVQKLVKY